MVQITDSDYSNAMKEIRKAIEASSKRKKHNHVKKARHHLEQTDLDANDRTV